MSYRVRLTETAKVDFEERVASLAKRSPEAARRLIDRFDQAVLRLRDFPFGCGLAYENSEFSDEIRHLLFGIHRKHRYRALFIIQNAEVIILAIRAPGEKPVKPEDL